MKRQALLSGASALALFVGTMAGSAHAQGNNPNGNNQNGTNQNNNKQNANNPPASAATPELDSLALFGTGALGLIGYGLTRRRARQGR